MSISPNVVIMTEHELFDYRDKWFQKGVERGRFEQRMDESRAKATEGKAGMAVGTPHVRLTTAGTGLRVGEASADLPTTSEFMDVTAGETAPNSPAVAETRRTESAGSPPRAVFSDPLSATRKDAQR